MNVVMLPARGAVIAAHTISDSTTFRTSPSLVPGTYLTWLDITFNSRDGSLFFIGFGLVRSGQEDLANWNSSANLVGRSDVAVEGRVAVSFDFAVARSATWRLWVGRRVETTGLRLLAAGIAFSAGSVGVASYSLAALCPTRITGDGGETAAVGDELAV